MKRSRFGSTLRLTFLASAALQGAFAIPLISIQSPVSVIPPGDELMLTINATAITDLYAFQFDLSFAPGVLTVVSENEGPFLLQGGITLFIAGVTEQATGVIKLTADTLIGPVGGVSGDGTLVDITFRGTNAGQSAITLANVILLDSHLLQIAPDTSAEIVTVTPEPGMLPLFVMTTVIAAIVIAGRSIASRHAPEFRPSALTGEQGTGDSRSSKSEHQPQETVK